MTNENLRYTDLDLIGTIQYRYLGLILELLLFWQDHSVILFDSCLILLTGCSLIFMSG